MEGRTSVIVVLVVCIAWQAQAAVKCTSAGRFANPDDTTCQNYTLCVYDSTDDYFVSFDYVCPTNSVFNPDTSQCTDSSNFVCNVTSTTNTTTSDSDCTANGYFAGSNSKNCRSFIECVEINGTFTETTYTCPDGTYFNPNTTNCEFDYKCAISFTCSGAGRFANTADTSCKTYYFCVLATNGTYVSYEYTCPTTSVFNPDAAQCTDSSNYVCNVTSTTNTTTSDFVCTTEGYFAGSNYTNCTNYIECVEINGAFTETTYTCPDGTYFNPISTYCEFDYKCAISFTCSGAGRFANTADTSCKTYYFCVLATNGTYVSYEYICPTTSVFNPDTAQCTDSSNYVCNVTSTTNTTTSDFVCTTEGYFAGSNYTNCTNYIECVEINGAFTETTYTCPDGTYFNPISTNCEFDYKCAISFTCSEAGRFANTVDTSCKTYYFCVLATNGTYVSYEYTCPTTSVFNPDTAQCTDSSNYMCNVTSTTNTTTSDFVCTTEGYFAGSNYTNCTNYIECVEINGAFTETTYTCPDGTYFNPISTNCEFDYKCAISFTCSGAGRFANTVDTSCKTYYFCVLATNGTYVSYEYTCPTTSVFNPDTAQCTDSSNYVCNVTTTTNTTSSNNPVCTAEGYIADSNSTTCTSYIDCIRINDTFTETTYTCPDSTYFNPNTTNCEFDYKCAISFTCSGAGRFANSADTSCRKYYFCVLFNNGTYASYEYSCPTASLFSPSTSVCTTSYTCRRIVQPTY